MTPDQLREQYREDSDLLARFLKERTLPTPHGYVRSSQLFTAWSDWCHKNGIKEEVGSTVTFAASMKARGFEKAKRNIGAVWLGLMLLGEEEDETP